jgi:hypothetical protein
MSSHQPGRPFDEDVEWVMDQFGVAYEQVARDHVISQVLAGLAASELRDKLILFGGTALSRTHLPGLRLSEDIDLITTTKRSTTAQAIMRTLDDALARLHSEIVWRPPLYQTRGSNSAMLTVDGRIAVRIQLLSGWDIRIGRL